MKDTYRSCASVIVFRPTSVCSPDGCSVVHEFLLLHKPRKCDAWQLPQGGVEEGETLEEAAMRELQEEAGITGTVLGKSSEVYQYDFPSSYRSFRPDHVCGQCIEFVIALLNEGETVQVDQEEVDAHTWILPEQIPQYIQRKEYAEVVERLVKEGQTVLP